MDNYRNVPFYRHSGDYAYEHGEFPLYCDSLHANEACGRAIETALAEHYHYATYHMDTASALAEVREFFDDERIRHILAISVRVHARDGRICDENKEWANEVDVTPDIDSWGYDHNRHLGISNPHIGLIDLFVTHFREDTTSI